MRTHLLAQTTFLAALCTAAAAQAPFEVALLDGSVLAVSAIASRDGAHLELTTAQGRRTVALADVLSVHGAAVVPSDLPVFELGGGERLRGVLSGGDSRGEWLELVSPVLGRTRVAVDRLGAMLLRPGQVGLREMRLPDGVAEALFQPAGIGLDVVAGALQEFSPRGVRFQRDGGQEPRWYAPTELVGLRIGDAMAREQPAPAELLTRTGDRIGVQLLGWRDGSLELQTEGSPRVRLAEADFACLLPLAKAPTFLSALEPTAVVESGFDAEVLYPYRRDANVLDGPLVGGGRTHARGLGVHSQSRLTFTVPPGVAKFWTRVALDASSLALPARANVHVEVRRGDQTLFAADLDAGGGSRDTGLIDVQPGQQLVLAVDFGRGRDVGDRVDWLSPVLLPARAR